jgi:predicted alpha/beta-fold hydrolase
MVEYLTFDPLPFFKSPHRQTITAALPLLLPTLPSIPLSVKLADGDTIVSLISTPAKWHPEHGTIVLLHGLDGSDNSPYMARVSSKLYQQGYRVVRVNYRGCGAGAGLARKTYTGGCEDDILMVLQRLKTECPASPMRIIGFSLGGHVALRLAGKLKQDMSTYVEQVIALCPPVDLAAAARRIGQPHNRFYELIFLRGLKRYVDKQRAYFPDFPKIKWPSGMNIYQFDDIYTAPHNGYSGADDYYQKCKAVDLVPQITVPTHILFADDDTMIDGKALDHLTLPPHIRLWKTKHGGHLGFIGSPQQEHGTRWLEGVLMQWLRNYERRDRDTRDTKDSRDRD